MSSIWTVEEDGVDVISLGSPTNTYYLLEGERLLHPQTAIGYCKDCASYVWVESLVPPGEDDLLARNDESVREWLSHLQVFLKARSSPPRCLHCGGAEIVDLDRLCEKGVEINPFTGKRFQTKLNGVGCFIGVPPLFLSADGVRIELPEEKSAELLQRGHGNFVA